MNKNILLAAILTVFTAIVTFGQAFGPDVIIQQDTLNQRNVEITTAFNGWIFEAHSTVDEAANSGGITISKSTDGGYTWTVLDSYISQDIRYEALDLVVAGTSEASLTLYVTGVNHNIASGSYTLYVDRYDAVTGSFIGSNYNLNKGTNRIYDVEIASDYMNPAMGASPYSVGLLYSCYSSTYDSIVSVVSIDGGANFANRNTVGTTGSYFRNVSLDYGRSTSASNGRYFAAWERLPSSSARTGNIYTSRNSSTVDGNWITPVNLDSLSSTMIGLCRNPRIACSRGAFDNDSGSVSSVVLVDRDYNADGSDYDMLGFYNKRSHYTNFWYRLDIVNSGENDVTPDILFAEADTMFHAVYFDSTKLKLTYVSNEYNLISPSSWNSVQSGMNDIPTASLHPIPRIAYRPGINELALAWIDEDATGGVAKFDIESFIYAGVNEQKQEMNALLYPNPVKDQLFIELDEAMSQLATQLTITDLNGRVVRNVQLDGQTTLSITVDDLANGTYMLRLDNQKGFASRLFVKE